MNSKVGDTRKRVEEVLKSVGIIYEYDPFQNRYQGTITDKRCPYEAIQIYVTLDISEKLSKVEVFESYTAP